MVSDQGTTWPASHLHYLQYLDQANNKDNTKPSYYLTDVKGILRWHVANVDETIPIQWVSMW